MIAVIPCGVFTVLHNAVVRPQGSRKHHIDKTVVVDGNAVQAFHFAIGLDFLLDKLTDFGQCRAEEFVIAYIGGSVCQALAVTVHAEPFGMFFQYLGAVMLQIHGPQPGIHFNPMLVGYGNGYPVIVGSRRIQHDSVHADVVHHLADGVEVHTGTIVKPRPEHGILLGCLFSPLLARKHAQRKEQQQECW